MFKEEQERVEEMLQTPETTVRDDSKGSVMTVRELAVTENVDRLQSGGRVAGNY